VSSDESRRGTTDALRALFDITPPTAHVVRNGEEHEVPTAEVLVSDVLIVRPGEKIPVDGELAEGTTDVDEALVTGESLPVRKTPGDDLVGGSINATGAIDSVMFLMLSPSRKTWFFAQKNTVSPSATSRMLASRRRMNAPATRQPRPARRVGDVASSTAIENYETGYFCAVELPS